jgi:hypothetical protein
MKPEEQRGKRYPGRDATNGACYECKRLAIQPIDQLVRQGNREDAGRQPFPFALHRSPRRVRLLIHRLTGTG